MYGELKMMIKNEECIEVKKENPKIYKNILLGYRECMPGVNQTLLDYRFNMNNHILNKDFEINPKYFIAFDDSALNSQGIIAISALYVFPKYRKNGFAKELINNIKYLAQQNIVLQIAVNEKKYEQLKRFYEKMEFKTTGKLGKADILNLRYIDLFWCINPIKLTHTPNGTKIERI